ncbi:unnamed protein product [Prorocentrum cordatum]|uniref:C3H1-type domain-containing protein n=1 Tax=Prorocentrum cordatum TaxID=2364126 RepID=A0ABN9QQ87_9DINO|nr:unnamed protein product [Polarella glacialis]
MDAAAAGRGAAVARADSHDALELEERMRRAGERRKRLSDLEGMHLVSCTTQWSSCSEGEHAPCGYARSSSDSSLDSEESARSDLPSGAPGDTHGAGMDESFEYPFGDDDDDYQIEAAVAAETPEGPVLSGSCENDQGWRRRKSDDVVGDDEGETAWTESMPLPSVGSQLHASGQCKPCAWYWKPGSCQNGASCLHCHECPEGEILDRKRSKVKELRLSGVRRAATDGACHQVVSRSLSARVPAPTPLAPPGDFTQPRAMGATQSLPLPPGLQAAALAPPPGLELEPMAVGRDASAAPLEAAPALCLPSVGSSLHASGACKPCAWHLTGELARTPAALRLLLQLHGRHEECLGPGRLREYVKTGGAEVRTLAGGVRIPWASWRAVAVEASACRRKRAGGCPEVQDVDRGVEALLACLSSGADAAWAQPEDPARPLGGATAAEAAAEAVGRVALFAPEWRGALRRCGALEALARWIRCGQAPRRLQLGRCSERSWPGLKYLFWAAAAIAGLPFVAAEMRLHMPLPPNDILDDDIDGEYALVGVERGEDADLSSLLGLVVDSLRTHQGVQEVQLVAVASGRAARRLALLVPLAPEAALRGAAPAAAAAVVAAARRFPRRHDVVGGACAALRALCSLPRPPGGPAEPLGAALAEEGAAECVEQVLLNFGGGRGSSELLEDAAASLALLRGVGAVVARAGDWPPSSPLRAAALKALFEVCRADPRLLAEDACEHAAAACARLSAEEADDPGSRLHEVAALLCGLCSTVAGAAAAGAAAHGGPGEMRGQAPAGRWRLPEPLAQEVLRRYADILRVGQLSVNGEDVRWETNASTELQLAAFCAAFCGELRRLKDLEQVPDGVLAMAPYWLCKAVSINYALIEVLMLVQEVVGKMCTIETRAPGGTSIVAYFVNIVPSAEGGSLQSMHVEMQWAVSDNIVYRDPCTAESRVKGSLSSLATDIGLPPDRRATTSVYLLKMRLKRSIGARLKVHSDRWPEDSGEVEFEVKQPLLPETMLELGGAGGPCEQMGLEPLDLARINSAASAVSASPLLPSPWTIPPSPSPLAKFGFAGGSFRGPSSMSSFRGQAAKTRTPIIRRTMVGGQETVSFCVRVHALRAEGLSRSGTVAGRTESTVTISYGPARTPSGATRGSSPLRRGTPAGRCWWRSSTPWSAARGPRGAAACCWAPPGCPSARRSRTVAGGGSSTRCPWTAPRAPGALRRGSRIYLRLEVIDIKCRRRRLRRWPRPGGVPRRSGPAGQARRRGAWRSLAARAAPRRRAARSRPGRSAAPLRPPGAA